MLPGKKRPDHADEGDEGDGEPIILDFAWILFVALELGYREKEVACMYYGKWCDLFEVYKKMHNIRMRRVTFEEPRKEVSLLDL